MIGSKSPKLKWMDAVSCSGPSNNLLDPHSHLLLTYKARTALKTLLHNLQKTDKTKILLPSFNCPSVVQTVLHCGLVPVFYTLNNDLEPDINLIEDLIDSRTLAVLAVHYFGFEADLRSLSRLCQEQEICLIEDWSHSFLQAKPTRLAGSTGDYAIYSFWKIVPTSVGGCVRSLKGESLHAKLRNAPWSGIIHHLRDTILWPWQNVTADIDPENIQSEIAEYDKQPQQALDNSMRYAAWYSEDVRDYDVRMPLWGKRYLNNTDFARVIEIRRRNYKHYLQVFSSMEGFEPVFSDFPESTCPWAFPVYYSCRNERAPRLRSAGIPLFTFGETLHPIQEEYFREASDKLNLSRRLVEDCLCLPLHQDITEEMIEAYADIARRVSVPSGCKKNVP